MLWRRIIGNFKILGKIFQDGFGNIFQTFTRNKISLNFGDEIFRIPRKFRINLKISENVYEQFSGIFLKYVLIFKENINGILPHINFFKIEKNSKFEHGNISEFFKKILRKYSGIQCNFDIF